MHTSVNQSITGLYMCYTVVYNKLFLTVQYTKMQKTIITNIQNAKH